MNTVFCIPSLGRPEGVRENSIKTLHNLEVPKENIYVFVADEQEKRDYATSLGDEYNLVVGELGIGKQRAFINDYFTEGTRIVSLDDDVTLLRKEENKTVPLTEPLLPLVTKIFDLADSLGCRWWGIPDYTNGMFLRHQIVHGMRNCAGSFFGEYSKDPDVQCLRPHGEDIEKQIKHYLKYGGILRVDDIAAKQSRFVSGGVNQHLGGKESRLKELERNAQELADLYPEVFVMKENYNLLKGVHKIKNKTLGRYSSLLS